MNAGYADNDKMLTDRIALVTGAGGGLGSAVAERLAAAGATVWAADVRADALDRLLDGLASHTGTVLPLVLDVRDAGRAAAAVDRIHAESGSLDVLVNNAAVDVTLPVTDLTPEDADKVVGTDLLGPVYLCLAAYRRMVEAGSGHIVNILSTAAVSTWTEAGLYSAAKTGLRAFTHVLFQEARRDCPAVGITGVIAGGMRTPFIMDRFPDTDPGLLQDPANVAEVVRFVLSVPSESLVPEVVVIPRTEVSWP